MLALISILCIHSNVRHHTELFEKSNKIKERKTHSKPGELKRLTPAPRTTHCPPLHGLPYGLLHGLPYGLLLRTTLKNQPNSFYGVQKYKKLTCSSYTIITARKTASIFFSYISRPSLFHFAPFFTGRPPDQWSRQNKQAEAQAILAVPEFIRELGRVRASLKV